MRPRQDLSLNTVKRYARAKQPERLQRAPQYRPALVGPYRDHLRKHRARGPRSAGQAAPARGTRAQEHPPAG